MEPSPAKARSLSEAKPSASFRLRSSPSLNSVRLRRIFDLFDKNRDGVISVPELSQALQLLGLEASPADVAATVAGFVPAGGDGLGFEEFRRLHQSLDEAFFGAYEEVEAAAEADLSEAFKVFDVDGDGFISAKELQAVLGKLGLAEAAEMERVERMITSVDRNADGRVDFFEFKDMMRSVIVRSA